MWGNCKIDLLTANFSFCWCVTLRNLQLDYQQLLQAAREPERDKEQGSPRCYLPDTGRHGQAFQPYHWYVGYFLIGIDVKTYAHCI